MGAHRNKWSPDTCGCVVEFEFDDALPEDKRTHALHTVHQKCKAHESLPDEKVWAVLHVENIRKNHAVGAAIDHLTSLGVSVESVEIGFTFTDKTVDDARTMELVLPLMDASDRQAVTDALALSAPDVVVK
jgi:hypothetical protein